MSFTISSDEKKSFSCHYRLKKYGICVLALSLLVLGSAIVSAESLQLNAIGDRTVTAGDTISFTVSAVDPASDQIIYSVENKPSDASFNEDTGDFSWTPGDDDLGDHQLQFSATYEDLVTENVVENVIISVTTSASASVESLQLSEIGDQAVTAGTPILFTVSAVGPAPDQIIYGVENMPSDASIDEDTGEFFWITGNDDLGDHELVFFATDETSRVSQSVTISVSAPVNENNPPILPPVDPQYVDENSFLTFTLSGNDPDEDEITYSSPNLPDGANLTSSTGIFEWTPAAGQAGTYYIDFTVSDGSLSASATARITVSEVNSETGAAPEIATISSKTVVVKNTLQFTVKASGGNDTLVFSATEMPSGATFDNETHLFKWIPSTSQIGMHSVTFKVTDGESTDEETVSIIVKEASESSGGSTGGSSSGGSSGGSSQASSEEYENIEFKDYSIKYVLKDVDNVFSFKRENNSIQSVIIRTRLNQGETKATVEMLKDTSSMAKKDAPGIVYRNLNIWVGDEKISSSSLIEAKVEFMVEKAWLTENSVDPASIKLLRYSDSWGYLPTSIKGQDKTYVYYTAKVPEFSVFAISSVDESAFAEDGEGNESSDDENISRSVDDSEGLNGTAPINPEKKSSWLILVVLVGMAGVGAVGYMYREQVSELLFKLGNSDGKRYRRSRR